MAVVNRFEIFLTALDPTVGAEIRKVRPCVVISPDEIHHNLMTAIIAPLTTRSREYRYRVPCRFQGKNGQIALDQIRSVDHKRFVRKLGRLDAKTAAKVLETMLEMFAP